MKIDFTRPIETPILFLVFNRPEKTCRVFERIRSARPQKLYVAADHPRTGRKDDDENCAKVKAIVENVDWPCETHYLYHPENRGCALAGKMAWDWLFSQEDEMIFLEDDGLVTKSFFYFCQAMLERYRHDDRIAYISGINRGMHYGSASYFFTRVSPSTYAMATWKRVYDKYEYGLESYPASRNTLEFQSKFRSKFLKDFWIPVFDAYLVKPWQTYDVQMNYLVLKYSLLTIVSNVNMTSNIGFDETGTHGVGKRDRKIVRMICEQPMNELMEIVDPDGVEIDEGFERKYTYLRLLQGRSVVHYYAFRYVRVLYRLLKAFLRRKKIRA